ncbi:MAG: PKD domain-containing protein, partial [Flavitalea sp.]
QAVHARHIKGGEISYEYIGPGQQPNSDRFIVTLKLFLDCDAQGQQLDEYANVGIFRLVDQQAVTGSPFNFPLISDEFINIRQPDPCILNPSPVCYRLRIYVLTLELPKDVTGYTAVFQRCCRIENLANLSPNNNIGSSYTCEIHGTNKLGPGENNSSPSFAVKDTVLICQNRPFQLDFGAYDPDKDSLSYRFIDAFSAPGGGGGGILNPVPPDRISFVSYAPGFSGTEPLGSKVTINPKTGLIAGVAPIGGDYVLSVLVSEWRRGILVSTHRKDFNIRVDERCDLAAALLKPTYSSCDDFSFQFRNEAPASSLIHTYTWELGEGAASNTNAEAPSYTYRDTGSYHIKLIINKGEQCTDSATSTLFVYPGFNPGFTFAGSCYQNPFAFRDTTTTRFGVVDKWSWNFGDPATLADSSNLQNPAWKYAISGYKPVILTVSSSKGCVAEVRTIIEVRDKPLISLAFRDTLICNIDSLRLMADGFGTFTWTPGYNILDAATTNPLVYPKNSTWYYVHLNENGCVNDDSVHVRVVDRVTLSVSPDTTICLTDSLRLYAMGDGLKYSWSNPSTLDDPTLKNPLAAPVADTRYIVTASIGSCINAADINVRTVPYPTAIAGNDTTVCYDDSATLHASIIGNKFVWTPVNSLSNGNILDPIAFPRRTTIYTLSVYDDLGCPKPGIDQVQVIVESKINAFAGNDTSVVAGQPLLLTGSGAPLFEWTPSFYMNRSNIPTPLLNLNENMSYVMKTFTEAGCFAYDTINIKVFKSLPDIFVPNAFAPMGRNRILRPIAVGIKEFQYFRIFNRFGQLVFQTSESGRGWDGTVAGRVQPGGTFVWMVAGVDYLGKPVQKRGTALLIR